MGAMLIYPSAARTMSASIKSHTSACLSCILYFTCGDNSPYFILRFFFQYEEAIEYSYLLGSRSPRSDDVAALRIISVRSSLDYHCCVVSEREERGPQSSDWPIFFNGNLSVVETSVVDR